MERRKLYTFILEACLKLEMEAQTAATACVLFHRFMQSVNSSEDLCGHTCAAACIYLAGKIEDNLVKIRDVINVTHRILHPDEPPLDIGELYWEYRDSIGHLELLILRHMAFHLMFDHPHKYLLHYLHSLQGWIPSSFASRPIAQTSWGILQDSYIAPEILLKHSPQEFALAVIFTVLKMYKIEVPYATDEDRKPWWRIMAPKDSRLNLAKLKELGADILDELNVNVNQL